MEEWKQLETIIGRYEGQEFQVRGWLFVLLGVLGAALFAEKPKFSGTIFIVAGVGLVVVYCSMEIVLRIPKRRAYSRVERIEEALRGEIAYDGPRISQTLDSKKVSMNVIWRELRKTRVWFFYVSIVAVIAILGIISGN